MEWEYLRTHWPATFGIACHGLAHEEYQDITSSAPLWTSRSALALASGEIRGPTSVLEASPGPTESDFAFSMRASFHGSMPPTNTAAEMAIHLQLAEHANMAQASVHDHCGYSCKTPLLLQDTIAQKSGLWCHSTKWALWQQAIGQAVETARFLIGANKPC